MSDSDISVPKENGQLVDLGSSPWPLETENPHPSKISDERWFLAENTIKWMIRRIQPTKVSQERRRNVVAYVQKLIRAHLGYEVFPFGSVPLKTYLPDGDIDLTAFGPYGDSLAGKVRSALERVAHNKPDEFEVKDVQYINAEVKLVKCFVQNIVVDISFNQIGGLCTLCFLEEVDDMIGKDHLFKRTIILIKAWCYYESRILGAHHNLISTYALETLVLYIFNLYHSSLQDPLVVLYRFLDYFSKFDWDNLCVSLHGPVHLSSLPEILAEVPETDEGELLFSTDFLNKCGEKYSIHSSIPENNRLFVKKYLNIVDPLKENNNLGRSVSKGNLYRIRSAFAYGARKLGKILLSSEESMANELKRFFKNTLERHGSGERPDVQDSYSRFPNKMHLDLSEVSKALKDIKADNILISSSHSTSCEGNDGHLEAHHDLAKDGLEPIVHISLKENDKGMQGERASNHLLEGNDYQSNCTEEAEFRDGISLPVFHDVNDLVTSRNLVSRSSNLALRFPSNSAEAGPCSRKALYAPIHLPFGNGRIVEEDGDRQEVVGPYYLDSPSSIFRNSESATISQLCSIDHWASSSSMSNRGATNSNGAVKSLSNCSLAGDEGIRESVSNDGELFIEGRTPDAYDLADLCGNHKVHLNNMRYAQCSHDILNIPLSPGNMSSYPQFALQGNLFPSVNGYFPSPPFPTLYPVSQGFINCPYRLENMPKHRGTGTFFPPNQRPFRDKSSTVRGRNHQFPANHTSRSRNGNWVKTTADTYMTDTSGVADLSGNGCGKSDKMEFLRVTNTPIKGFPDPDISNHQLENQLQFGSLGPVPLGSPTPEERGNPESNGLYSHSSSSATFTSMVQKPGMSSSNERLEKSYRLKDDDEFPPLSNRGNQTPPLHSSEQKPAWEAKRCMSSLSERSNQLSARGFLLLVPKFLLEQPWNMTLTVCERFIDAH